MTAGREKKEKRCRHLKQRLTKATLVLSSQVPETEPNTKTPGGFVFACFFFCKLTYMPIADDCSWCYWVLLFFFVCFFLHLLLLVLLINKQTKHKQTVQNKRLCDVTKQPQPLSTGSKHIYIHTDSHQQWKTVYDSATP